MKTINILEEKDVERLWEEYIKDHKYFYRCGDERDKIPRRQEPEHVTKKAKELFKELNEKSKNVVSAAEHYIISMRKDDKETFATIEKEYLNLIETSV